MTEENCPVVTASRWHVGKEVPIALILAVVLQTAGGVWWLSKMDSRLESAIAAMVEFKNERYTREDARRDKELVAVLIDQLRQVDLDSRRRIEILEIGFDRLRK